MDYKIKVNEEDRRLEVKVTCLLNQEIRKEILNKVSTQLKVNNFYRVLIDLIDSQFNLDQPMVGALELSNYMKTIGIPANAKFAFVYSEAEAHRKYFENVAQICGFNIRYFKSLDQALTWLME